MKLQNLSFKEHLKILNDDNDFLVYFYDHRESKKKLCSKILKDAEHDDYSNSVLFALESKRNKNEKVEQMAAYIGEELEKREIEHTFHVFFMNQKNFDQLKEVKIKQIEV